MGLSIKEYQRAFEIAVNKLKANSHVLAVVVFGSIVSGDIWEESDIDFLVITEEKDKNESIYSKIGETPIHINYMSRDIFISSYNNILKGGTFHKAFFSDRLIFCRDSEIEEIHNSIKFYKDKDRDVRNVDILCNLLSSLHYAKKYIVTGRDETAFQWGMEVLKNYARLIMNIGGYITDKDILSFAVSMDDSVELLFRKLNSEDIISKKLDFVLNYINKFINSNIEIISKPIIDYINKRNTFLSAQDIKESEYFSGVEGDISLLLDKLVQDGIIKASLRQYLTYGEEYLIDEVVYSV